MYKLGVDKKAFTGLELLVASIPLGFIGRHLTSPKSEESSTTGKAISYGATLPASLVGGLLGGVAAIARAPKSDFAVLMGILGGSALGGAGAGLLARIGRKKPKPEVVSV